MVGPKLAISASLGLYYHMVLHWFMGPGFAWAISMQFYFHQRKRSKHPPLYKQMEEFGSTLETCKLIDIGFHGYSFTWNNKRPGESNTKVILDRAVANTG